MTTTTPTPAPAPMTLPERLRAIRFSSNPDDYDAITIEAAAEIDALTARVSRLLEAVEGAEKALEKLQRAAWHKNDYYEDWCDADVLATAALATLRAAREGAR